MLYQLNEENPLEFLNDLNDQQKQAVEYCDSSQLVLSGAGSGKTRVLTYKIAYLIKIKNIPSDNILALTFTNKAANEMKLRISKLIGIELVKNINMGTFHSIFCKILRRNISYFPGRKYKPDFQIINEDDSKKLMKDLLETEFEGVLLKLLENNGINDRIQSLAFINDLVKKITDKITLLKNKAITYEHYQKLSKEIEQDKRNGLPFLKNFYEVYVKECQKRNIMDFDDLLLNTFILFNNKDNIDVLQKYQKKFKYILVDEYQDTNHVQFEILKALSWQYKRVCGVGDDYQSIYSFRGADLENFKNFNIIYSDSKNFNLTRNYRSTSNIVQVANLLIKKNKNQFQKNLYSNIKEIDGKVKLLINKNSFDECDKIAYIIKELIKAQKCEYKDIAVLYRMNLQSNHFVKTFFKHNIPHKLCNRIGFYETTVIKNILSYLNFIINPNLDFCLKRIIDYPPRGIGKKTRDKLFELAKSNMVCGWEIIKSCGDKEKMKEYEIDNELMKKLLPFKALIENIMSSIYSNRIFGIVSELIETIKLKEYLKDKNSDALEKIEILLDKINEMEEEHISNEFEKYTLNGFLEETNLLLGNEEIYENKNIINNENKVKLMTIHQAKGLEFEYVFIVGLEDGFYPSSLAFTPEEIEEERRILYVAITRAKINCYLSYSIYRRIGDEESKRTVSPFVEDINDGNLIQLYQPPGYEEFRNQQFRDNYNQKLPYNKKEIPKNKSEKKIQSKNIEKIKNKSEEKNKNEENIEKKGEENNINKKRNKKEKGDKLNDKIINKKKKNEIKEDVKNEDKNFEEINIISNNFICCRENDFVVIDRNIDKNEVIENINNINEKKKKNISEKKEKHKDGIDNNKKNIKKKKSKREGDLINPSNSLQNENNKKDKKLLNKKRFNNKTLDSFVIFK